MSTDLEILRADLAAARLPRPRARVALLVVLAAATTTAVALAANHYLGQPAPPHVKATFARLAAWQPANDSIEVSRAQVVAVSPHTVLYEAPTASGGYCLELLGHRGFVYQLFCSHRQDAKLLRIFSGIANHGTPGRLPPVAVTGQMSSRGRRLEVRTPSGVERVPTGLHGFFSFEPADQDAARRGEATLVERDEAGRVTATTHVPAQIVLDSQGAPARSVEGIVFDRRARHVFFELWARQRFGSCEHVRGPCDKYAVAQTGIAKSVDLQPGGHFSFTAPQTPNAKAWFYSMSILDGRFRPLDPNDVGGGTWVPDEQYWKHSRAEAQRNGV